MNSLMDVDNDDSDTHCQEKILLLATHLIPFLDQDSESNSNSHVQRRIEDLIHTLQYELLKERLKEWYHNEEHDLLTGMWLIATYQYPDIEQLKLRQELEQLYYETWLEFKPDLYPFDQVKVINSVDRKSVV